MTHPRPAQRALCGGAAAGFRLLRPAPRNARALCGGAAMGLPASPPRATPALRWRGHGPSGFFAPRNARPLRRRNYGPSGFSAPPRATRALCGGANEPAYCSLTPFQGGVA